MAKFLQKVLWDDANKGMFLKRTMNNDFIFVLYKFTNL